MSLFNSALLVLGWIHLRFNNQNLFGSRKPYRRQDFDNLKET
jgi:hypothetical protein